MSLENLPIFLLNFSESEMKGGKRHSYRFKAFRLEVEERQLLNDDQPVALTPKAFDVLVALVERSGHLVEKDELMQLVWSDSFVEEANLARLVHTLRKVLGDDGNGNKFIETVAKKGYRFVAKVSEIREPAPPSDKNGKQYFSPANEELTPIAFHPNDHTENSNGTLNKPPEKADESKPSRRLILIAVILTAIALVVGSRFSVFNLFQSRDFDFHSIQMQRLTDNSRIYCGAISPDGRFVALVEEKDGRRTLFVKQISTGATITIIPPTLNYFYQPTFTPDSEFIYYVAVDNGIGTLYRVPVLGGESRKLATDVDSMVTFSPDGKRMAFIRYHPVEGGTTIFTADCDGTNLEAFLTTKEAGVENFFGLDWSPDGEKLLVGSDRNIREAQNRWKFFTIGLTDKKMSEFVSEKSWHTVRMFKWLKDGTGLLLVGRTGSSENSQIWHIDYPQGASRQITSDTNNYGLLSISADNRTIAATQIETVSSIWSFNPQSKEMRQILSENSALLGDTQLSQLPDGKIIFVKAAGRDVNIFSIKENGEDEKQLTSKSGINQNPAASPDGSYIVFSSNRNVYHAIWRMNADGTGAIQLTKPENATDLRPEITPDGKTVIFVRYNSGGGNSKLLKIPINGGEATVLLPENNAPEFAPRISPDGRQLAFLSFDWEAQTANMKSYVNFVGFNGEGADGPVRKAESVIAVSFRWSPDNQSLSYTKKSGIDNIWNFSPNGRQETPLTDFTSGNITDFIWSNDGKKIFLIKAVYNNNLVLIKNKDKKSDTGL
jgi:Tol biopolymer transport system component/DNA-binding winged helix-turn-helix (wHTH) protein